MLFFILVGILSCFFFAAGFTAFNDKDARMGIKLGVGAAFFVISLSLALACRYV